MKKLVLFSLINFLLISNIYAKDIDVSNIFTTKKGFPDLKSLERYKNEKILLNNYRIDNYSIVIEPKKHIEFKVKMQKGSTIQYNWYISDGFSIYSHFHGEPLSYPKLPYESYFSGLLSKARGSLYAP